MNQPNIPDLSSKLLTVHIVGGQHNYIVEKPMFENQCGRWFLVGITPGGTSKGNWAAGVPVAIAWDQVSAYRVFESAADYLLKYSKAEQK